ncbi:hypothetical protein SLW70_15530 [Flavobacterium sp. NG2]|uniref:hypothetical protein n=1 Tax=Flavobacterium sp. NG2 TaxID=3097547 RepID=UPI002A837E4D|nr:hypothetical protein [Flavobacterium sp. NG2]WPR71324.1 hypothetical protein SLW70_15530 [Flavobacterium sp. NG2]
MQLNLRIKTAILSSSLCIVACNLKEIQPIETNATQQIKSPTQNGLTYTSEKEFRYDYSVTGTDEQGRNIYGFINLDTELGEGKLITHNEPSTVEVVVEINSQGKILATDVHGNKYFIQIK